MQTITMTPTQAGNVGAQFIALYSEADWLRVTYDGAALIVPDDLAAAVAALDPDLAFVPVPAVVSMFQARAALIAADLIDDVETALAADTSTQGKINAAAWEYSTEVRRASALVGTLGTALGLTSTQIDDLFRAAFQITV